MATAPRAIPIQEAVQRGIGYYQTGNLPQAEAAFRAILRVQPNHPDALHFLGLVAHQAGHHEHAIALITHAIRGNARNPYCHNNLGEAYRALGRLDEAKASYRTALKLKPDFPEAHNNLGAIFISLEKYEEAMAACRQAILLRPAFPSAHNNLATALGGTGDCEGAVKSYHQAIALNPDFPEAHNNLGNLLRIQRKLEEALSACSRALVLRPDFPEAHNSLGNTLHDMGRQDQAMTSYQQALHIRPDYIEARHNLGRLFHERGWLDDAEACFRKILSINPKYIEAYHDLCTLLTRRGNLDEALDYCRQALSVRPDAAGYNSLGNALRALGRVDDAFSAYGQALEIEPGRNEVFSNWLHVTQSGTLLTPDESLAAHRAYADRFEAPLRSNWQLHDNSPDHDKRLKIGYLSADFRNHPVAYFMEPILANHDKGEVEIHCYYNGSQHDEHTDRLIKYADAWVACESMTDEELAAKIRADRIDILVDLSGHTAGHRLLVFARKPAPVQVTYLGYATTTGLCAMDYRLTHELADPIDANGFYSETLYRLPSALWCYRPQQGMPEVSPVPALRNGFVTFGSMNSLTKVSSESIAAWAKILHTLPDARLVMVTVPDGSGREIIKNRFADAGISPERLTLHGRLSPEQFWALHSEIDIALDPFPYNGGTTTCETLWLGVPVISLTGTGFVSRLGHTLLNQLNLPELVADSPADYVAMAIRLARDLSRQKTLRNELRLRMSASPIRDEAGFTRHFEAAYRDMWHRWCLSNDGGSINQKG